VFLLDPASNEDEDEGTREEFVVSRNRVSSGNKSFSVVEFVRP